MHDSHLTLRGQAREELELVSKTSQLQAREELELVSKTSQFKLTKLTSLTN